MFKVMLRDTIFEKCSLNFIKIYNKFDNKPDKHGNSLLHTACLKNRYDIVYHLLVRECVDPNVCSDNWLTPLHIAVSHSNINVCILLLKFGANPNAKDFLGSTPLHIAYTEYENNLDIINLLYVKGANFGLDEDVDIRLYKQKMKRKHAMGIYR